jgi:hypothetical protein
VKHDTDRSDYSSFVSEYGLSEAELQRITQNEADQVPMPDGFDSVRLGPSELHGLGMFATRDVQAGEWLAPARWRLKRTPAGRYTNHAKHPNCAMLPSDPSIHAGIGDLWLVATQNARAGEELTVNYRQVGQVNGHGRKSIEGAA